MEAGVFREGLPVDADLAGSEAGVPDGARAARTGIFLQMDLNLEYAACLEMATGRAVTGANGRSAASPSSRRMRRCLRRGDAR